MIIKINVESKYIYYAAITKTIITRIYMWTITIKYFLF